MASIHLANAKGRDAEVTAETVVTPVRVRWIDGEGRPVTLVQILRGTIDRDVNALATRAGSLAGVAELLMDGDPEVDLETYGSFIDHTSRVYVGPDKRVAHRAAEYDVVKLPDGTVKEKRPRQVTVGNMSTESPLRWSGKYLPKAEVVHRFVLAVKTQIVHVNGLTYDFLYAMAEELQHKNAFLRVGGGPKANQPLVFHRGATPYPAGFLEGRTQGDKYQLVLHLSNQELKAP
jgi:hypothetical protein